MKTSILEYLEESARKYPDKTAFADEHTSCTFKELEQTARRTGTALAKHFTPRNPVPVFMEKSVETIGVFMGAVYAGCFYVLMDTKQPASRLQQILGILDSDVIVTSEKYLKDLEKLEFKGKVLMVPDLAAEQENDINIVNSKLITPPKSEKSITSQNSSKISVPCVAPKVNAITNSRLRCST